MKQITRDGDNSYLQGMKQLLEENGIPAHIGGENVARVIPPIAMTQAGLWVYLNHQYTDALRLVENPSHQVSSGIDVEAFYENRPKEGIERNQVNQALIHLGLVVVGIIALFFVVSWGLDSV